MTVPFFAVPKGDRGRMPLLLPVLFGALFGFTWCVMRPAIQRHCARWPERFQRVTGIDFYMGSKERPPTLAFRVVDPRWTHAAA